VDGRPPPALPVAARRRAPPGHAGERAVRGPGLRAVAGRRRPRAEVRGAGHGRGRLRGAGQPAVGRRRPRRAARPAARPRCPWRTCGRCRSPPPRTAPGRWSGCRGRPARGGPRRCTLTATVADRRPSAGIARLEVRLTSTSRSTCSRRTGRRTRRVPCTRTTARPVRPTALGEPDLSRAKPAAATRPSSLPPRRRGPRGAPPLPWAAPSRSRASTACVHELLLSSPPGSRAARPAAARGRA
jgi:hypothetical protein